MAKITKPATNNTAAAPKGKKPKSVFTGDVVVKWAHLHQPDVYKNKATHNITVPFDGELKKQLEEACAAVNGSKINGVQKKRADDPGTYIKFKTTSYIEQGRFPCVDSNAKETNVVPFGGDTVRLRLTPFVVVDDNNSVTFFLSGVQIINKVSSDLGTGGFDKVDGGYVAPDKVTTSDSTDVPQSDEDVPF